jgi:hypothetical protein
MKKLISFLSIIVVLSSCEKDVNIKLPQKDPKLVINGLLAVDSTVSVSIGRSRSVLDPVSTSGPYQEQYVVKNAIAVVYENTSILDTLVYDNMQYRYVSPNHKTVKAGNTYSIIVNAPGYKQAEASTIVPSQSVIDDVVRVKNARTNSDGNPEDEITLKLNDPAEANFYLIQFYHADYSFSGGYPVYCVSTTDKDIEAIGDNADPFSTENCYDGNSLLMKDVNFNGRLKLTRFYINSYELQEITGPGGQVSKPYVKVSRITEDYFKFVKSYNVYSSSYDNPFAEPANVYTNVKNGYGVFSVLTEAGKQL